MDRRWAWMGLVVVAAVVTGGLLSARPWQLYREQKAEADKARRELAEAQAARAELTREKARLESTVGKEEAARRRGWSRQGEVPLEGLR